MEKLNVNLVHIASNSDLGIAVSSVLETAGIRVSNFSKYAVFPGFCDVHVHFREPGFSYKETIRSGSLASARGGYTAVCTMPNLNPVPDSVENLNLQRAIIEKDACIHVYPYGAITVGEKGEELADMEAMAKDVCGFSDDGRGVQSDSLMEEAMVRAKSLNKIIFCEGPQMNTRRNDMNTESTLQVHPGKSIGSLPEPPQCWRNGRCSSR
mgnify:CR=1 FL=1